MPHSLARDCAEYNLMRFYADKETASKPAPVAKTARYRFEVQELKYADSNPATLTQDYFKRGDAKLRMSSSEYVRATVTDLTTGQIVDRKS